MGPGVGKSRIWGVPGASWGRPGASWGRLGASVVQGRADAPAKTDEWVTSYSMNEDGWVTSFQDTKNNEYQLAHPAEASYGGVGPTPSVPPPGIAGAPGPSSLFRSVAGRGCGLFGLGGERIAR